MRHDTHRCGKMKKAEALSVCSVCSMIMDSIAFFMRNCKMCRKKQMIFFAKTIDIMKNTVYNSFENQMKQSKSRRNLEVCDGKNTKQQIYQDAEEF